MDEIRPLLNENCVKNIIIDENQIEIQLTGKPSDLTRIFEILKGESNGEN